MSKVMMPKEDAAGGERIVLSERDTHRVLTLLESPPEPTPALRAAARRRGMRADERPIERSSSRR